MIIYIDSSALLSIILRENDHEKAEKIWLNSDLRLSSILLEAECKITLRRICNQKKLGKSWIVKKLEELTLLLEEVNLSNIDRTIIEIIDLKTVLSECRSLDAIHLATAIEFQKNIKEKIGIFSFDKDFISLGKKLGFKDVLA
jgi:predicted nucleic acid-binding protein